MTTTATSVSLLYPPGYGPAGGAGRPAPDEADLALGPIARALDIDGRHARFVAGVLADLNGDPQVIGYRQDVLDDLLRLPELAAGLAAALPQLGGLAAGSGPRWGDSIPLLEVARRLAELDAYVSCVESLWLPLAAGDAARSAGLLALRALLAAIRAEEDYRRLVAELPALRAQFDRAGSVTLGINLDAQLRPESAAILSINQDRFAGKSTLLEALFGERAEGALRGITALYRADDSRQHTPEHELFRDLNRLLERVVAPVAGAVTRYVRLNSGRVAALEPELAFYLGAARMANELRAAGLPLCRPTIAPPQERACAIDGLYSLDLALRLRAAHGAGFAEALVLNDVEFGPRARLLLLTGPNSGGKTTYARAVGQAQLLFQAGLLVPGWRARITPADAVFTHFATAERPEISEGRLAEELDRMARIFQAATSASLLLLNEPLSSTDHVSAHTLGRDILAGLQLLGARALWVTHLHTLVEQALAENARVVSLVAETAPVAGNGAAPAPTYRIAPGQPAPPGYAAELARRHGLSLAQIAQTLRERGLAQDSEVQFS